MKVSQKGYDYIIAGGGCAGLSLAMMLKESKIKFDKILIVDKHNKKSNDRTWCFWSKEKKNWFDKIVFKKWKKFNFSSEKFSKSYPLEPYQYFMIRGIDFYEYCFSELKKDSRFDFIEESIVGLESNNNHAILITDKNQYSATYIFNSAIRHHNKKAHHVNYVQHFKGILIETIEAKFDAECPTFMDFSVEQHNDCRFVYVIPYSSNKALIEYTGFSSKSISDKEYDTELDKYIKYTLKINDYKIIETEVGEIPMAESDFVNPYGERIINIGTAGGYSKPSTGFTFYFIQKNLKKLVSSMEVNKPIKQFKRTSRFAFYDKVLLDVINEKIIPTSSIFTDLFRKNKIQNLMAFLNEESSIIVDLKIMNSVPRLKFMNSALKKAITNYK